MGMVLLETRRGGRVAKGNTLWGSYLVEWDETGRELQNRIILRKPGDSDVMAEHAEAVEDRQEPDKGRRVAPPGDWLRAVIYVATFGLARHCLSCGQRRAVLNKAGWAGLPALIWAKLAR